MKWLVATIPAIGLAALGMGSAAVANPGQEQACAGRVAEMRGIPMSEVRVHDVEGSQSGIEMVELHFPGGSATCWVDRRFDIHDIHWSRAPERTHHPKGSMRGDSNAQEQACAARMADEMSMPMSGVRVASSNSFIMGSRQVMLTVPGMRAQCTADVHNHVVYFKYLGDR